MGKTSKIRTGASARIPTEGGERSSIPDNSITEDKYQDLSLGESKIKTSAVSRPKMKAGAIAKSNLVSKTSAYPLTDDDDIVLADSSGGAFTLTLATAVGALGRICTIKKTSSDFDAITIEGDGAETIDGDANTTINTIGETLTLVSDGSNWQILDRRIPSVAVAYTPTIGGLGTGGVAAAFGYWKRVGDSVLLNVGFKKDGSAGSGSANVFASLPSSMPNIDTNKLAYISTLAVIGSTKSNNAAVENIALSISSLPANVYWNENGDAVASGDEWNMSAIVPISGWKG